ncbi:RING finger protein 112-like [Xenopus laevis]|uniref:RING finger protein 112-like n=1 Tax=Xenopus laevis TaxID=8355 RepID=A0A8J1LV88_XENLA|nr:RING finger protein 112-like [Xenopus laevis]OCT59101.1 hypothetical protein XELAEV_18001589mg [Xenopus laevis]
MRRRGGTIQKTRKDGTCLLCSHNAQWLQTIPCGHTFCRGCITPYRKTSNPEEYHCPQCRKDIPPHAIQLVYTDKSGQLQIEGSAVEICFADPKVSEFPIHVISVIGVRHLGKSFLLNFILRALANQEKGEQNILGEWNESLTGFEWGSGTDSITRGIWIWNRPFILEFKGKKVAVFVLDTEGSQDIGRSEDISIKLSALSMVLSSYLIFNVHSLLNSTTLDYLEIYLTFAKEIEESSDGLCLQVIIHPLQLTSIYTHLFYTPVKDEE